MSEELLRHFTYDANSGSCRSVASGRVIGSVFKNGYVYVSIKGRKYLAHRLAWLWVVGQLPDGNIDHVDGDKTNNKWANLRAAGYRENGANRGPNKNNKAGLKGVYWHAQLHKWTAQISIGGTHTHLGCWNDPIEAAKAYDVAAIQHFGKFAKTNHMLGLL